MRNIPFAFVDEEIIDQINRADRKFRNSVDAFANLAETQKSMRGTIAFQGMPTVKSVVGKLVATLEKMMEMSGPNSMANLERAMRRRS